MPKLKPEELETRKREILEAARACFLRSGFHRTTTDEICKQAAITPGGLYHYFGSKQEIISAVIEHSARETVQRLRSMLEASTDVRSAFREVGAFFLETMQDPEIDNVTRLELEVFAEALKDEKLAEITRASWALRRAFLESLIQRGVAEGVYSSKEVDARGFSSLLLAVLVGLRIGKLLWREDFDVNGALRALFLLHTGRLSAEMEQMPPAEGPGDTSWPPPWAAKGRRST